MASPSPMVTVFWSAPNGSTDKRHLFIATLLTTRVLKKYLRETVPSMKVTSSALPDDEAPTKSDLSLPPTIVEPRRSAIVTDLFWGLATKVKVLSKLTMFRVGRASPAKLKLTGLKLLF
jgi:hypothetical protein